VGSGIEALVGPISLPGLFVSALLYWFAALVSLQGSWRALGGGPRACPQFVLDSLTKKQRKELRRALKGKRKEEKKKKRRREGEEGGRRRRRRWGRGRWRVEGERRRRERGRRRGGRGDRRRRRRGGSKRAPQNRKAHKTGTGLTRRHRSSERWTVTMTVTVTPTSAGTSVTGAAAETRVLLVPKEPRVVRTAGM